MDAKKLSAFVDEQWNKLVLPTLFEFIRIPNKSPAFDPQWHEHGFMDQAAELLADWCRQQSIAGMQLRIERLPGRTPLLFIEVAGTKGSDKTVVLYGHLDKQPEMDGWDEGLSPWQPVLRDDHLYGRGGADDGYSVFAALTAIEALQQQGIPHGRCIILIEGCEESGSQDLPFYIEKLKAEIGEPDLIIGLDSSCGNYDQLWCSTSLRGILDGVLTVEILTEGVHSGAAGGIVPSTARIIRQLLSRIENEVTGEILMAPLHVDIPARRKEEAKRVAEVLGDKVWEDFPFVPGAKPLIGSNYELILNRTWRPTLAITGVDGLPTLADAGNVMRPKTALMLSLRIPPTCDADAFLPELKRILERDPPYNAKVSFKPGHASHGWNAPELEPWLAEAIMQASQNYFGNSAMYMGGGGTIPFMNMFAERFPQAQFMVTGVLGPRSNAHGPNEFLHIPTVKKVICCVAEVLSKHYQKSSG
jgi:acetylornithine deacetylase/succinyl-diaminopimelate desuccinylase-like protein